MIQFDTVTWVFFLYFVLPTWALTLALFITSYTLRKIDQGHIDRRFTTLETKIKANDKLWLDYNRSVK